jgi:MFS transporter, OFA family, oxalate/formate antiporter
MKPNLDLLKPAEDGAAAAVGPPERPQTRPLRRNRWVQLAAGIVGMVAVANFQYAWTLFVLPMRDRHGWGRVELGDAFNAFVLAQTWLVPLEGYLADRFGPRRLLFCGGVFAALAWVILSQTSSLPIVFAAQVLSGCGSGMVYGISMGNALKWFPDRRGLAAGLTAAAFGAGSALTVLPIARTIQRAGYEQAFLWFGLGQGVLILVAGLACCFPTGHEVASLPRPKQLSAGGEYNPGQVLRSPAFWLLYVMMMVGAVPGLLMTAQLALLAADYGVTDRAVSVLRLSGAALPLALMVDRVMGGLTRPFFGWVSDRVGRERAIFAAFALEGVSLYVLISFAANPVVFVVASGVAFFGWGSVFSLFPAAAADLFGRKYATTNNGLLYTAKGMATFILSFLNRLQEHTASWVPVFAIIIAFDALAAVLAVAVLQPLRVRWQARVHPAEVPADV